MSPFPRRTDHTVWHNPEPFAEVHEALELLNSESPTFEPFHLEHCFEAGFEWQIVVPWYSQGSSGGDTSGHHYFQIDADLAKRLVDEGLVEKRRIPYMGYTETKDTEFVISQRGKDTLKAFIAEMRAKAESMLVPGIHTDLTSEIAYRGHKREHWRYGSLFFQFELPAGGMCKVYPKEERLDMPEESKDEAA